MLFLSLENNIVHLYLFSPLHTGGTTQEGNLLGIARESHTNLPYIPSSTIRGKLRSSCDETILTSVRDNKILVEDRF
jgi:CRISPR-associated protein Cmr4